MRFEICKDCADNDPFYGCTNQDCEVYIDLKIDAEEDKDRELENERF